MREALSTLRGSDATSASVYRREKERQSIWRWYGNLSLSEMMIGMHPAAIDSYNRFADAVSPRGAKQNLARSICCKYSS